MKCKGCKWKTAYSDNDEHGNFFTVGYYCIGSPEHETREKFKKFLKPDRIGDDGIYLVEDSDECVLPFSDRFEPEKLESEGT